MAAYAQHVSKKVTPQSEKIPGSAQVPNSAGGYSFEVDCWTKLNRFLILGNEGGSYYASEKGMTLKNVKSLDECAAANPAETVQLIVGISVAGRAPKNDPAVFALAYLIGSKGPAAELALAELNKVCRIGTHLFQFAETVDGMRGWGPALRRAVANWYKQFTPRDLAYQLVKYQQRNGWAHRDLLRLCHLSDKNSADLRWAVKADLGGREIERTSMQGVKVKNKTQYWKTVRTDVYRKTSTEDLSEPIAAFEAAKKATSAKEIVKLIEKNRLVRECIPTAFLNDADVWEALLQDMPVTAMIRSLGKMSSMGLLKPLSDASKLVVERLQDVNRLKKGRVHPIALLIAQKVYAQGHGDKGSLAWTPVPQVIDVLDDAFYKAFATVEPTNKRWLLALDVSGSMDWGQIAGTGLTPRQAAGAMALVTAKTEPNYHITAFSHTLVEVNLSRHQRLDGVLQTLSGITMGGTDCSLPIVQALNNKWPVDAFVVYTDSETWAGRMHPPQTLQQYRNKMGINAKLIVCGLMANDFTIADPNDAGMMDVVGFDANVPQVMAEFVR